MTGWEVQTDFQTRVGISQDSIPTLEADLMVITTLSPKQKEQFTPRPHGQSVTSLRSLLTVCGFMMNANGRFTKDYRVVVARKVVMRAPRNPSGVRRRAGIPVKEFVNTLSFWCLNPAVIFLEISDVCRTVVLTSGTLSPMSSFSSELGTLFSIIHEGSHVIEKHQVFCRSLARGPAGTDLQVVFKNFDSFTFQDEIGQLMLQIVAAVPFGILVFFPSYGLMGKLLARWQLTGVYNLLSSIKNISVEPSDGDREKFDGVLNQFYSVIRDCEVNYKQASVGGVTGAIFFAVFRGKVG